MIRYYCDICGEEITPAESTTTLMIQDERVRINITRAIDGMWNDGQICIKCLLQTMNRGEIIDSLGHSLSPTTPRGRHK